MLTLKTIDAHAAGEPLRLIVDGFPSPHGKTMLAKREWVRTHADHLRRALMHEPRGHADMYGAILTEPVTPGSHAGILFMHNEGYSTMCGHGIIAVTTMAIERGLIMPGPATPVSAERTDTRADGTTIVFDAPAGTIRARAKVRAGGAGNAGQAGGAGSASRVDSVTFLNVPSFVLHGGLTVKLASRTIRADVAFGGAFYATIVGTVNVDNFTFQFSVIILCAVILGGMGNVWGSILGGVVITWFNYTGLVWISDKLGFNLKKYEFAFFGLVLVVMMLFRPQGFIPAARTKQVRQAEKEMEATIAVAVES